VSVLEALAAARPGQRSRRRLRELAFAIGAVLVALSFVRFGFGPRAVVGAFFAAVLVVLSVVDLEERRIPNRIVLPATAVVLAAQVGFFPERALEWVVASLAAALFLLLPLLVYPGGMGMGDVKMALLLGAALGQAVVVALLVGTLVPGVLAAILLASRGAAARKTALPYGPFLALGGLVALFFGAR
jgi:leader peptidase (prepilin peptidase)/N-methyltransferase